MSADQNEQRYVLVTALKLVQVFQQDLPLLVMGVAWRKRHGLSDVDL